MKKNTYNLMRGLLGVLFIVCMFSGLNAQPGARYIVVDQFGYLPEASKIAVIRDPHVGYDADEEFTPGDKISVINSTTGDTLLTGPPVPWRNGEVHSGSGDKVWHFDFSEITHPGTYYVLDHKNAARSYDFVVAHNVYNEVLKQAVRSFFYQRAGFPKEAQYAGEAWADGASHLGDLQDANCRSFFDKDNPESEKDLRGGWYDAGDYNKYTNWTANYVVSFMRTYMEHPEAFGDDYNIPESGNGVPDLLDEAKWGIDWLLRMQQPDGSVLSIMGLDGGSPPSSATGPSYYGPPNTSATLNTSAAFALASKVYRDIGMEVYADTLVKRAGMAWDWAETYPDSLFNNNDPAYQSEGLGAGRQEVDRYNRLMIKLEAALHLYDVTGESAYLGFFEENFYQTHLLVWPFAFPFEITNQQTLLYYTTLDGADPDSAESIRSLYTDQILNGTHNLAANMDTIDPYLAYMKDYGWGSNGIKARQANLYMDLLSYGIDSTMEDTLKKSALCYINYLHGVNPLSLVYLSNMGDYGAENSVKEFYHSWFTDGSVLWDRVGESTYGPAPGFLTGGANPQYTYDQCCPYNCGSMNSVCTGDLIPPLAQPNLKSYKEFNTSWPANSWSVTENSCGYQVQYIQLLSKFVVHGMDCSGEAEGDAGFDACGVCAGGSTGIIPETDPMACLLEADCNGDAGGVAYEDSCGLCAGGNTGRVPVLEEAQCYDCNNVFNGDAVIDACDRCAGGDTGIEPILDEEDCYDCNSDFLGEAFIDSCGNCAGGNTGMEAVLDPELCNVWIAAPGTDQQQVLEFQLRPNDELFVRSAAEGQYRLTIFSLSGSRVYDGQHKGDSSITLGRLANGVYHVIGQHDQGTVLMKLALIR